MAKNKKLHISYNSGFHTQKPHGCIWKHATGWGKTECHYAVNGYNASDGRKADMYNKHDHRQRAIKMGYALEAPMSKRGSLKMGPQVARALTRKAASKFPAFNECYERKFGGSLKWLSLDPKGWNYGYVLPQKHVPKKFATPQPTFYIKNEYQQGYGAWYPYHHNYHHMIPIGAFHEYVIGKDDKSLKRVQAVVMSEWNINKGLNIVLLPQETFVARIVGLPAHCPWGIKHHASYSKSLKDKLKEARRQIDKASDTEDCEDAKEASIDLDGICRDILEQIKQMTPGRKLRALK